MLKVTLIFSVYCMALVFFSCKYKEKEPSAELVQHYRDSVSEARIDSAYKAIKSRCDTQMLYQVPIMVDSFLKNPALVTKFFDTANIYTDADKKVEKVIRQLLADCDSNLLKETYKIARYRQQLKPQRHKK